ncbi:MULTISPECIES: amidohydrolase [Acidianus]|uniref:Amidohydrolase n=1 Tax=Candidatus Acidianus copahuensis TaxID=1160895 RepID=A0A031LTL4_9CREN|nr:MULTISPECIES: amidohydrolase [Acidianus]EZQ10849.1 amidohydrolase [Candidatus Acidianus copahuensis]NON61237.1 amidohydrolase [Acidianus sp. RZ1]
MKVLIKSGLAFVEGSPIKNVNIGINEGRIEVISRNQIEEYNDAELVISGNDRIVSPGFIVAQSFIQFYPLRYRIFSGKININELISSMDSNIAYHFSLLGAYHLLKSGVTTVLVTGPFVDSAARAVKQVGLKPIVAVGVGCYWDKGDWKKNFISMKERWGNSDSQGVVLKLCDENYVEEVFHVAKEFNSIVLLDRTVDLRGIKAENYPRLVGLGGGSRKDLEVIKNARGSISFIPSFEVSRFPLGSFKPSISIDLVPSFDIRSEMMSATTRLLLTAEEAFKASTEWGYLQLGIEGGILSVGKSSDIIIFQANEPPAYPMDIRSPYETLIFSSDNLETVIRDGEAILDGGVSLNIGSKDIDEASEKVEEIDKRVEKD